MKAKPRVYEIKKFIGSKGEGSKDFGSFLDIPVMFSIGCPS
jgi:hypothetical protein